MFPRVKDRSDSKTGITTVGTSYSFAVGPSGTPVTNASASTYMTNDYGTMKAGKDKNEEIAKTSAKEPYYPDQEMYMCTGSRLLADSDNKTRPFRTVRQGGQPQQFYAPVSRGGVRIFQNPSLSKTVTLTTPGPSVSCRFSAAPTTQTVVYPCKDKEEDKAETVVSKAWGERPRPLGTRNPLTAGYTRGYRGAVSLSGTSISRESTSSTLSFQKPLPVPFTSIERPSGRIKPGPKPGPKVKLSSFGMLVDFSYTESVDTIRTRDGGYLLPFYRADGDVLGKYNLLSASHTGVVVTRAGNGLVLVRIAEELIVDGYVFGIVPGTNVSYIRGPDTRITSWGDGEGRIKLGEFSAFKGFQGQLPLPDDTPIVGTSLAGYFEEADGLASSIWANVERWDVSGVTDFSEAFLNVADLETLDLSLWDFSSARLLKGMFTNCSSLNIAVVGWSMTRAEDVSGMFAGCISFTNGGEELGWTWANKSSRPTNLCAAYEDFAGGKLKSSQLSTNEVSWGWDSVTAGCST